MALSVKSPGNIIASNDVDQFIQLLTGEMADTPVLIGNSLGAYGAGITAYDLLPPTGPSVGVHGTPGVTSHTYTIISHNSSGDSAETCTVSLTTSPGTLNGSNYNILSWTSAPGAASYVILRDGLVIASPADSGGGNTSQVYNDQGGTGTTYTAASVIPPGGRITSTRGTGSGVLSLAGTLSTGGAPTVGAWLAGDIVADSSWLLWLCTVSGTPGTWISAGSGGPIARAYANPGTAIYILTNATWQAMSTSTLTVSFKMPSTGFVYINAEMMVQAAAHSDNMIFGMLTHGTLTLVSDTAETEVCVSTSPPNTSNRVSVTMKMTGTAGTVYSVDLGALSSAGTLYVGWGGAGLGNPGPAILTVWAS